MRIGKVRLSSEVMVDSSRNIATLRGQWVGQRMREYREAANVSLSDAADYLGVKNASTVSRYETGVIPLRWTDVDALLTLYGVSDQTKRDEVISLAKEAWRKGWWDEYRDVVGDKRFLDVFWLERRARHIQTFGLGLAHGLLQTPAYMDAVFRDDPAFDQAAAARATQLRLSRQRILTEDHTRLTAILGEATLHQRVGSPEIMREQLTHLLELGKQDNITIRIFPFDATVYRALAGGFDLFELEAPYLPVAYVENLAGCLYVEAPAVDRYQRAYNDIQKAALTPSESASVITRTFEVWK